ncbi:type 1 glutamine amidotransferase domain-containing protein [Draconibacterium halophilum]|uniref:Type 1 glutamine amidotransferase n=1 Tax=Draconibacterium halophilum TaxID=2706887 RepID=A0A6C0RHQ2_9BACT|nr:type 1 glutamine amidotransferase domain-containing protein [Draconibacterium halophilum]QIA09063.1 type 1 glutamine amidotransferase [Draconibacterium halophilum]
MQELKGKKVAILATNGFEESELFEPLIALKNEGVAVDIISTEKENIKAWNHGDWSKEIEVDCILDDVDINNYGILILPGGVINPDKLRRDKKAVNFVRSFFDTNKSVAAICHGPQMLIEAEVVKNRTMTSFFSIKKDLQNAGANWVDEAVVEDGNLITSRNPGDLEAFNAKIISRIKGSD